MEPIDPAELAQKTPKVEADSDSEVIFWDVQVEGFTLSHYRRIKVFNTRGRDFWSTVTIPHTNGTDISHIAARTVHPDGSSLELGQNAIRETVDRIGHQQIRNTVFVIQMSKRAQLLNIAGQKHTSSGPVCVSTFNLTMSRHRLCAIGSGRPLGQYHYARCGFQLFTHRRVFGPWSLSGQPQQRPRASARAMDASAIKSAPGR